MGVKSTSHLSRAEAEELYVDLRYELSSVKAFNPARRMSNAALADALEQMSDETAGGEGFRNFIVEGDEPSEPFQGVMDFEAVLSVDETLARSDGSCETWLSGSGLHLGVNADRSLFDPAQPGTRMHVRVIIEPE